MFAIKFRYKSKLLASLVSTTTNVPQLQALASQLPTGCAGLAYGNPPHISDAIGLLWRAWESIHSDSVAACWRHEKCLPQEALESITEDTTAVDIEQTVQIEMQRTISTYPTVILEQQGHPISIQHTYVSFLETVLWMSAGYYPVCIYVL